MMDVGYDLPNHINGQSYPLQQQRQQSNINNYDIEMSGGSTDFDDSSSSFVEQQNEMENNEECLNSSGETESVCSLEECMVRVEKVLRRSLKLKDQDRGGNERHAAAVEEAIGWELKH